MDYLDSIKNYLYNFIFEEEPTIILSKKNYFNYDLLDNIDFNNTDTGDIVILLNNFKHEYDFKNFNINLTTTNDKLEKLKCKLQLCLQNPKDTTDKMIKYIKKYKGEKNNLEEKVSKNNIDEDILNLEKRFLELIKEDNIIEYSDDEDNENQGAQGVLVKKKQKIALKN